MNSNEALILLAIAFGAFIMPFLSKRIMIPAAVGEILYGMLIGSVLHIHTHTASIVHFLAELGFLILMYIAGLELEVDQIKQIPRKRLFIYIGHFVIIYALSAAYALWFNKPNIYIILPGIVAIGLLFSVLKETKLLDKSIGQQILIFSSLGEVISLIAITFFTLYFQFGVSSESAFHLVQILGFCITAYFALKGVKLVTWWFPHQMNFIAITGSSAEMGMRSNFLNMLVFAALASFLNLEIIIGAFIGGILYGAVFKEREHILEGFEMLGNGFLIPMFFVYVGLTFDINLLKNITVLKIALEISLLIFGIRILAMLPFMFSGWRWRNLLMIPLSTAFPLTLLVAVAKLGESLEMISKEVSGGIVLSSIITALIYPMIMKFIISKFFIVSPSVD